MYANETLELTKELISRKSVTPEDAGCQILLANYLQDLGFNIVHMPFGETKNLLAIKGMGAPHFMFAGHTDVVPSGDERLWKFDPFTPTIDDGKLYGRGVADMKGGIAAMMIALKEFLQKNPNHPGTISVLITSDEEGPAHDGTKRALENLPKDFPKLDYCIVGEPTSNKELGDTIKNGSRGSTSAIVKFTGKQGHVGYAHLAHNPIHTTLDTLSELTKIVWDKGDEYFPPTSLQITNLNAGVGAENVIPEELTCNFNLRFSPKVTPEKIHATVNNILKSQPLPFDIEWKVGGMPFISEPGVLTDAVSNAIYKVRGIKPRVCAIGGTSDARFIINLGCEVLEMGLSFHTIHAINEHVECKDLEDLQSMYRQVLVNIFS